MEFLHPKILSWHAMLLPGATVRSEVYVLAFGPKNPVSTTEDGTIVSIGLSNEQTSRKASH